MEFGHALRCAAAATSRYMNTERQTRRCMNSPLNRHALRPYQVAHCCNIKIESFRPGDHGVCPSPCRARTSDTGSRGRMYTLGLQGCWLCPPPPREIQSQGVAEMSSQRWSQRCSRRVSAAPPSVLQSWCKFRRGKDHSVAVQCRKQFRRVLIASGLFRMLTCFCSGTAKPRGM